MYFGHLVEHIESVPKWFQWKKTASISTYLARQKGYIMGCQLKWWNKTLTKLFKNEYATFLCETFPYVVQPDKELKHNSQIWISENGVNNILVD